MCVYIYIYFKRVILETQKGFELIRSGPRWMLRKTLKKQKIDPPEVYACMYKQTYIHTDRPTDGQTDDRQTCRNTDIQTYIYIYTQQFIVICQDENGDQPVAF